MMLITNQEVYSIHVVLIDITTLIIIFPKKKSQTREFILLMLTTR